MPIDWSQLLRRAAPDLASTPAQPPAEPLDPVRATVLRITGQDRDEAIAAWPTLDLWRDGWPSLPGQPVDEPSTFVPAPAWDGTDRGMCVYGGGR